MTRQGNGHSSVAFDRQDFYYSTLNLPRSAAQNEIRERYRALSVTFHPDKQHDESIKATASKKFLEIQKAYEILSDPFLRAVYDILGEDGLAQEWPAELRSKDDEAIRNFLMLRRRPMQQLLRETVIRPTGAVTVGVNASSLFAPQETSEDKTFSQSILKRVNHVGILNFSTRHGYTTAIGKKTKISLSARAQLDNMQLQVAPGSGNILGTVVHQFSPRIEFQAATAMLRPRLLNLKTTYRDSETEAFVQAHFSPSLLSLLFTADIPYTTLLPLTASVTRRLFVDNLTEGTIVLQSGPRPNVSVNIISPTPFDFSSDNAPPGANLRQRGGSESGFAIGSRFWGCGATLSGISSALKLEAGLNFRELALQVKFGLEWTLAGADLVLTSTWQGESSELATAVGLNAQAVYIRLECAYMEQRISVPIVLSTQYDSMLGLGATVVPVTALVLGYHFILKPRRKRQRATFFRAARLDLADSKRAINSEHRETLLLLKDTAQRHMRTETSKSGLVIEEATYGPSDEDEESKDLVVDVTVAVQALVNNSQLHIPAHRSKSAIQGFVDPAPTLAKSLYVRYYFRGNKHYAEIPDHQPVVLPLKEHYISL